MNVMVVGVSASALNVTWEPPTETGGSRVLEYIVEVNGTTETLAAPTTFVLIRDRESLLMNTSYE